MDEDDQTRQRRQEERAKRKTPQHKYNDMLQLLADRKIDEFAIDLDDLATVSWSGKAASLRNAQVLTAVSGRGKRTSR